jgi:hypothetical protein
VANTRRSWHALARANPVAHSDAPRLKQVLIDRFDDGELRGLCADLNVDYDVLPGEGKADKARELTAYLERRGRQSELVEIIKRLCPGVAW